MRRWRKFKISFRSIMQKSRKPALGTVSLFLSLIVTPILGLTCLMVETIRYQDVIEELTEISDISALSTLAHYDEFLKARFGLLATSQEEDISSLYTDYFNKNSKMIGKDFNLVSSDVEGAYSLRDIQVMRQQILEYCEICSAVEIALNGLGVSDLFDQLMEALKLDEITKYSNGLSSTASLAKNIADLINDIKTVVTMTGENGSYTKAKNEYEAAYTSFESSLQSYISALNNSTAEGDAIYQDVNVVNAWNSFAVDDIAYTSPRTNYINKINNLASQVNELKGKVIDISVKSAGILEDIKGIREATKDEDDSPTRYDYVLEVGALVEPLITYKTNSEYDKQCQKSYAGLIKIRDSVNGISMKSYNHGSSTTSIGTDYYFYVPGVLSDTINAIFSETLAKLEAMATGEQNDMSSGLMNLVSSLCNIQGACNPQLNAIVGDPMNPNGFDENAFASAVGTVAIVGLVDAVRRFTMPESIVDVLLGLVELIGSIIALIVAITGWAEAFLVNIARIVKTGIDGELGNAFLLCGYAAYNFPNRTNYKDDITFTGYDFKQEMFQNVLGGDPTNPSFSDNLAAMEDLLAVKTESPTKPSFMGAEAEYLLCGYQNELQNQCGAFYNVMMLRMLLDFIPILTNSEVRTEASGAGPYAWIIYILIIVAEPIFDTFILVNGGKEPLIKTDIYLTPSGAPKLAEDIISFCSMMENIKNLSDTAEELNSGKPKVPKADGDDKSLKLLNCSYTEHLWILFFLSLDTNVLMNRIQNVVNYESNAYYAHHEKPFELGNANTYIHSNIKYTINPMFDFSSMTDSTIIDKTISSDRYIGY